MYYVNRISWTRNAPNSKNDGARHWYSAKAVKDYIILLNKKEFTLNEL